MTIDLDATLICVHREKEGAAGTFEHGYGFAPMLAYGEETGEALGGEPTDRLGERSSQRTAPERRCGECQGGP